MKIIGTDWEDDLLRRAMSAWFRSGAADQPSNSSEVVECDKKVYVCLRNVRGLLAVYRVRIVNGSPALKRLQRWPARIDGEGSASSAPRDIDLRNPLPRSSELLALDRPLTTEEKREVKAEIANAEAAVKELKTILNKALQAARAAK